MGVNCPAPLNKGRAVRVVITSRACREAVMLDLVQGAHTRVAVAPRGAQVPGHTVGWCCTRGGDF